MGYTYDRKAVPTLTVTGGYCDRCNVSIPISNIGNLVGACELEMHGWYGGFIDPHDRTMVVLCKRCSQEAWDIFFGVYGR